MRHSLPLALALLLGMTPSVLAYGNDRPAPPPAYGGGQDGDRPAPPPAYGNDRPTPPPGYGIDRPTPPGASDELPGPVANALRTARNALDRFEELSRDLDRAYSPQERDAIEVRMMDTMGEALDSIHQTVTPRQGPMAERIYKIVEPAYKKAWLQRYEWKQERRTERKRQRLTTLNLHLRQSLRDVRAVAR